MDRIDYWFDGKRFVIDVNIVFIASAYTVNIFHNCKWYKFGFNDDKLYDDLSSSIIENRMLAKRELNISFNEFLKSKCNE